MPNITVAFSAYSSEDTDYDKGTTVLFNQIVTNIGGYYDNNLGVFMCPISGIYQFSSSLFTSGGYKIDANVVKENVKLLAIFSNNDDNTQASTTVFTECMAFEKVWVQSSGDDYRVAGGRQSSFSGALMAVI